MKNFDLRCSLSTINSRLLTIGYSLILGETGNLYFMHRRERGCSLGERISIHGCKKSAYAAAELILIKHGVESKASCRIRPPKQQWQRCVKDPREYYDNPIYMKHGDSEYLILVNVGRSKTEVVEYYDLKEFELTEVSKT